jgi:pyroglutamyl-peptidase
MKLIVLLGLIFFCDLTLARRRILITAFEPFAGRPTNGSQEVAALLPGLSDPSVEYVTCILPVEYDRASQKAKDCYAEMDPKPDMVISTGEGACTVQVETRALNLDNTPLADNAGVLRAGTSIDDRSSPYTFLSLPAADMVCAIERPEQWQRPNASTWAGFFVCNNTAFHLSRFFSLNETPYGFIHLPRTDCKRETPDTAATLNTMIRAGISSLENRVGPGARLPCDYAVSILSTDISPLLSVSRAACEQKFRDTISELLSPRIPRGEGDVAQ